jgi:hypothetical protein
MMIYLRLVLIFVPSATLRSDVLFYKTIFFQAFERLNCDIHVGDTANRLNLTGSIQRTIPAANLHTNRP